MYTVLGEGAFGCVIRPACPSTDRPALPNPEAYVSKIFLAPDEGVDDAEVEWANYQRLLACDPDNTYTTHCAGLGMPAINALPSKVRRRLRKFGATGQQLLYAYGGQTLRWHADRQDMGLRELLLQLTSIVDGLEALAAAGVMHLDIKPPNIVIKEGTARLIDFGFVSTQASLLADDKHELWEYGYEYWPPELDFLYKFTTGKKPSWKDHGSNRYGNARTTGTFSRLSRLFPHFSKHKYDNDYAAMCARARAEIGVPADSTDADKDSYGSCDSDDNDRTSDDDSDSDKEDGEEGSKEGEEGSKEGKEGEEGEEEEGKEGEEDKEGEEGEEGDDDDDDDKGDETDETDESTERSADGVAAEPALARAAKTYVLHHFSSTADLYALGVSIAVAWRQYDRAEASDLSTRETKNLTRWVRCVTHVNGYVRWQPAEAAKQWHTMWRLPPLVRK